MKNVPAAQLRKPRRESALARAAAAVDRDDDPRLRVEQAVDTRFDLLRDALKGRVRGLPHHHVFQVLIEPVVLILRQLAWVRHDDKPVPMPIEARAVRRMDVRERVCVIPAAFVEALAPHGCLVRRRVDLKYHGLALLA